MEFTLAPMEGVTGYVIRGALHRHFGYIDRYYTPFIPASKRLNKQTIRDIHPENNQGMTLIPQLMTNQAEEVLVMHEILSEYGYNELNINLGCPSGTVTSKKRGSGLLAYPEELELFLDQLYDKVSFPVSIKTRIGFTSEEEWDKLLSIYQKYPMSEFIVHPRVGKDMYRNHPLLEAFAKAVDAFSDSPIPLVYNGDITDLESFNNLFTAFPSLNHCMIGRGLMANPALCRELVTGSCPEKKQKLRDFHDDILEGYGSCIQGSRDVLMHMKQLWGYLIESFEDSAKLSKQIKKSQSMQEYSILVNQLFENCPLK